MSVYSETVNSKDSERSEEETTVLDEEDQLFVDDSQIDEDDNLNFQLFIKQELEDVRAIYNRFVHQ